MMEDGSVVRSMVRRDSLSLVQEVVDMSWITRPLDDEDVKKFGSGESLEDDEHAPGDETQPEYEVEDEPTGEGVGYTNTEHDGDFGVGGEDDYAADDNGDNKDGGVIDFEEAAADGVEAEGAMGQRAKGEDEPRTRAAGREVVAKDAGEKSKGGLDPFFVFLSGLRMPQLYEELVAGGISSVDEVVEVEDAQELVDDYGLKKSQARKLIKAAQRLLSE